MILFQSYRPFGLSYPNGKLIVTYQAFGKLRKIWAIFKLRKQSVSDLDS